MRRPRDDTTGPRCSAPAQRDPCRRGDAARVFLSLTQGVEVHAGEAAAQQQVSMEQAAPGRCFLRMRAAISLAVKSKHAECFVGHPWTPQSHERNAYRSWRAGRTLYPPQA
jgi:hypothetical protein